MVRYNGPSKSGDTSRGVHIRALWAALSDLIDGLPDDMLFEERRRFLRGHRAALERAYALELSSDTEIAQHLAEEDGLPIEDIP